jgi:predicted  nucleic acid-binding Zn-ribbon protein
MISDQDIEKLKEVFPTKDVTERLEKKVDHLETRLDGIEEQVGDLRVEVGELHDKFDSMESKIDGLVGLVHASLEEHGAGAAHLARHDHQIAELAAHVGVTLSS